MSKRAAMYLRVSTTNGQTTDTQRQAIERYCKAQDWDVVEVYDDSGVSGAVDARPGLDRLKADVAKGKFDVVVVWRFDRMARSTTHLLDCLSLFHRYSVDFVSVTEAIDTSTPVGRMVYSFLAAIAEFEREIIRERVKAGVDRARTQGIRLGRPRVGFDVNAALRFKQDGLSWPQLAKRMSVSSASLRRSLGPLLKKVEHQAA